MRFKTITILPLLILSCVKLDDNLYNAKKIKEYELDNYKGEQDFILDSSYIIPQNFVSVFTLYSKNSGESNSNAIKAIYIGDVNKIKSDTVILYCHGNKWHMDFYWQRAKLLAHVNGKNRYGVLMLDYRGYGLSEGKPSEEGLYSDVDAAMKWLKEKGLNNERLIIYGFSLGSAPSCELTAKPRSMTPSKLILEAPFAGAAVMLQDASRLNMPVDYISDIKIDNAEEIKKISQPFLWIHGLNDNFLNYKTHGEVVYKNYSGVYQEKFLVAGADHGEVPSKMGPEEYLKLIGRFVRK